MNYLGLQWRLSLSIQLLCPLFFDLVWLFLEINLFKIIDEDQNRNGMVKALETTEVMLTINAICSLSRQTWQKKAPIILNLKASGWVTNLSLAAVAIYTVPKTHCKVQL
jgi:hypothetical protein